MGLNCKLAVCVVTKLPLSRKLDEAVCVKAIGAVTILVLLSYAPPLDSGHAKGADRFTEPPATSQRWFCLPSTLAHQPAR